MLTSKEQTFPTTGIAGGFVKLKRTIKKQLPFGSRIWEWDKAITPFP